MSGNRSAQQTPDDPIETNGTSRSSTDCKKIKAECDGRLRGKGAHPRQRLRRFALSRGLARPFRRVCISKEGQPGRFIEKYAYMQATAQTHRRASRPAPYWEARGTAQRGRLYIYRAVSMTTHSRSHVFVRDFILIRR